jgi:hypothetical protein
VTARDKARTVERWDCLCGRQYPAWCGYMDGGTDPRMSLKWWLGWHASPRCAPTQRVKA